MAHTQKRKIVPTGKEAGWLEARRITKDRGGLPFHVLLDDQLVRDNSDIWNCTGEERKKRAEVLEAIYPAWAREVLVHPEVGGMFHKGQDLVCDHRDGKGREWILPGSYIPEEAIGREHAALFIDPEDVAEERNRVIIHPGSIVVLSPFLDNSVDGNVDERTRIPLMHMVVEKRVLWKGDKKGIYPLSRSWRANIPWYAHTIMADDPTKEKKVSYVEPQDDAAVGNDHMLVKGATLDELRAIVAAADANLDELLQHVESEKLEGIRRLLQTLHRAE